MMPGATSVGRPVFTALRRWILEIDSALVTEDKTFVDDLGADSIALIELVDALEVEFSATLDGFAFDDDELSELKTVRDAVDYVVRAHGA